MPLLKHDRFCEDDYTSLGDDAPAPAGGAIIVPFNRLVSDFGALKDYTGKVGVLLANSEPVTALDQFLPDLELVALSFPTFTDGRAYSQARALRIMGFSGEIRAVGEVLPDQLQFMIQVGFDSFEVSDRFCRQTWLDASARISLSYQPVIGGARHIWQDRRAALSV